MDDQACDRNANIPEVAPKILRLRGAATCLAAAGLVGLAGCGGSSKPAYCSDRSNLESSVKGLTSLTTSSGIRGLKTQVQTIQSDATTLVSSAKSDFPSQTSAIKSSVAALESAVKALPSHPTAKQLRPVATASAGVVAGVKSFTDVTSSNCS